MMQSLTTSHQQTTEAHQVSKQRKSLEKTTPVLPPNMKLRGTEYHSGQSGSAVLAVSPTRLLPSPSLLDLEAEGETEMTLMLCEYCSATAKTPVCYRHRFGHQAKTVPYGLLGRKLIPSQPGPIHLHI